MTGVSRKHDRIPETHGSRPSLLLPHPYSQSNPVVTVDPSVSQSVIRSHGVPPKLVSCVGRIRARMVRFGTHGGGEKPMGVSSGKNRRVALPEPST